MRSPLARLPSLARPHRWEPARPDLPAQLPEAVRVTVVGGGIAGVSAALLLAERGAAVTLLEAAPQLGGRLSAWPRTIADGSRHLVEHGFHGFFGQYYTWRDILRRIEPDLAFLKPIARYPIASRAWGEENFTNLPGTPPLNLLALIARSPSLHLGDLRAMDGNAALPLLAYDRAETYARFDGMSAAELLDSLGLPERARTMLFDVFAHSFFNHEKDMSAAEMLMMFHFYFLRNPAGLDMDAPDADYETAIWSPLAAQLEALGVDIRVGARVDAIEPGWRVVLEDRTTVGAEHVVIAADPSSTRSLVLGSPGLCASAPILAEQMESVATTAPYAVARFWVDRDASPERAAFTGVAQEPTLDSISLFHRLERASTQWAQRTGGAIVELHAYAADEGVTAPVLAERMWGEMCGLWPEMREARIVDSDVRVGRDAPAFGVGSDATRPGVRTDAAGLHLAGDWVKMPFPSALMERSASSAALAANAVLAGYGARPVPLSTIPVRGLLAGRRPR